jgi:hypothetical protein
MAVEVRYAIRVERLSPETRQGRQRCSPCFRIFVTRFLNWSRAPGFTRTAVVSLTLGTGATTAVFSVVCAILMNPYP